MKNWRPLQSGLVKLELYYPGKCIEATAAFIEEITLGAKAGTFRSLNQG